jgi:hypothetical protein
MAITRGALSGDPTAGVPAAVPSATTLAVAWATGNQPAAGSKVLVYVQQGGITSGNTSLADNGTTPATWVLDKNTVSGHGVAVFRADGITLPSSGKFTVTVTSTQSAGTIVAGGVAYAGVATGGPSATNSGGATGTAVSAGAVTPAAAGALYFGAFSDSSGLNPETVTLNWAGGTQQFLETNGSSFWPSACADSITASGAQTPAWTLGDSVAWGAVALTYEAAAAGGTANAGLATAAGTAPQAAGGTNPTWGAGPWTLAFSDEFPGTGLDTTKWEAGWFGASGITPPVNSGSPSNNSANVSVAGGLLSLAVANIAGTNYGALITSNPNNSGTATGFQHGPPVAFEARLNLPQSGTGVANWCAWWTDGQTWPGDGEIDILESLGSPDDNTYHVHDAANPSGAGATHNLSPPYGWHTFGCYWHSSQVDFYYDGSFVATVATDGFIGPHYLILVNTYNTAPDVIPATMQVDWVRAWTPAAVSGSATAGLASGAGAARQAAQHPAGPASGAGAARQPAVSTVTSGTASAGLASGAGAAPASSMAQAGPAAGSGAAAQPAGHAAGPASGTGTAVQPSVAVSGSTSAHPGLAAGAGAAWLPYAAGSTTPHSADRVQAVESAFYAHSGADAGQAAEDAQMAVSGLDSCHAADRAARAWPSAADACTAAERALTAWPRGADTGHGTDAVPPQERDGADTGHAAEALHATGIWTYTAAGVRLLVPYRHDPVRAQKLEQAAMRLAERGGWVRVTRRVHSADGARCAERALAEDR